MAKIKPDNVISTQLDEEGYAHFISKKAFLESTPDQRFAVKLHNDYVDFQKKKEAQEKNS